MMNEITYLNNQFLIAMPSLQDSTFSRSVIFLCQHNQEGALGLVINRLANLKLGDIFSQMNLPVNCLETAEIPVYSGGPVHPERGFVLHTNDGEKKWAITLPISDEFSLTTSRDIIQDIAKGEGPKHYLVALGYAGWGAGQLEKEILANSWLNTPIGESVIFDTPIDSRWHCAGNQIGIDMNCLTLQAGHA